VTITSTPDLYFEKTMHTSIHSAIILSVCLLATIQSHARHNYTMVADTGLYTQTFCSSQFILINGHLYEPNNPTGIEVIPGGAANGMDSVFRVQLFFNEPVEVDYFQELCEFDTIYINGHAYHTGHYEDVEVFENAAANGCDSIVNVMIDFRVQPFRYLEDTLCEETVLTINGNEYGVNNAFGLEYVPSGVPGVCDTILYISLQFRKAFVTLGENVAKIRGDTVCINAITSTPPIQMIWSPVNPDPDPLSTRFCTDTLYDDIRLQVIFTDTFGCKASAAMVIEVSNNHQVYAPNVILAGSYEPFDRFFLAADPGIHLVKRLMIYDRWGEPIYDQTNIPMDRSAAYDLAWDGTYKGKKVEPGTFVWWAELLTFDGKIIQKSGDISVLR
jgi:CHU_C Type IX secretion signal domain